MKNEDKKVTSTISANCAKELNLLKSYLDISTISEAVRFVLEKNVSAMLVKAASKHLKGVDDKYIEEK